jgi:alpha-glucosidase
MRNAFLLRYALIPYIYTAARESYDTGVAMLRPMYYEYPEAPEAYDSRDQYVFGDDMIVAPVTAQADGDTELATQSVWLPQGEWIEWQTGARLKGGQRYTRNYSLSQIPVFVRAGAIVPMMPKMSHTGEKPIDPLILEAMPGAKGEARVYADEGSGLGYKDKAFTWTTVRQQRDAHSVHIEVLPVQGSYPGMLTERGYEIRLPGTWPPKSVTVNGTAISKQTESLASGWRYDGNAAMTIVSVPRMPVSQDVKVDVETDQDLNSPLLDGVAGKIKRLLETTGILEHTWPQGWAPDVLLEGAQMGDRLSFKPETAATELGKLDGDIAQSLKEIDGMRSDEKIGDMARKALAHLRDVAPAAP